MASALPLLLLGGAAILLMGSKKKPTSGLEIPTGEAAPSTSRTGTTRTATKAWKERQNFLLYADGMGLCDCDPGRADGVFGARTKAAVKSFQRVAEIKADGVWGPQTNAAMSRAMVLMTQSLFPSKAEMAALREKYDLPGPPTIDDIFRQMEEEGYVPPG